MNKFLNVLFGILCCLSIALNIGAWYIGKYKSSSYVDGTYNIKTLVNNERPVNIFNIKYFANKDKVGSEMFEFKMTYYTGINMNQTYSLGVQYLNPSKIVFEEVQTNIGNIFSGTYKKNFSTKAKNASPIYFATSPGGVSFGATTTFDDRSKPFLIDIEKTPYSIYYDKTILSESSRFLYQTTEINRVSNFDYFFKKLYNATKMLSAEGQGRYDGLIYEFLDVFNIYEYNTISKNFDVITNKYTDVSTYIGIDVDYMDRGAMTHEDSMFNQIGSTKGGVIW